MHTYMHTHAHTHTHTHIHIHTHTHTQTQTHTHTHTYTHTQTRFLFCILLLLPTFTQLLTLYIRTYYVPQVNYTGPELSINATEPLTQVPVQLRDGMNVIDNAMLFSELYLHFMCKPVCFCLYMYMYMYMYVIVCSYSIVL